MGILCQKVRSRILSTSGRVFDISKTLPEGLRILGPEPPFLAHLSQRLSHGELIRWDSIWRPSVRPFTLSNINISETSCPIKIKFHLKHHWGEGLTAKGFGQDRIRTLVSMAPESSHTGKKTNRAPVAQCPYILGWAPKTKCLGAQLAPEKR